MLLCVAGGGSSGFNRDRSREGSRCSTQSAFLKNNANQQIMVEERCSMTSTAVNVSPVLVTTQDSVCLDPRASRGAHNKHNENNLSYRGKVIVVRGEDCATESADGEETCATTTTFKSNIVNGKRSTNTILVRYKPSKLSPQCSEDFKNEFCGKSEGSQNASVSSSSSTISSESTSSGKKDKASISAWAQIMELEGYRSPAIGLDSAPKRSNEKDNDDSESSDNSAHESSDHLDCYTKGKPNSCTSKAILHDDSCYCANLCSDKRTECGNFKTSLHVTRNLDPDIVEYKISFPSVSHVTNSVLKSDEIYQSYNNSSCYGSKTENYDNQASFCKYPSGSSSNCSDKISEDSLTLHCPTINDKNCIKIAQKVKSPMYRSESSRVPKVVPQEKSRSRRKTLPDGNLQLRDDICQKEPNKSSHKKHLSSEMDPNASWGKYNSKAMRDSVRKVAQKYAEVYLRRQSHSKLDALPEVKGVQLTRYVSPYTNQDHVHSSKIFQGISSNLYINSRIPSVPSHLHHVAPETKSMLSNRRKLHLLAASSTRHDHNVALKGSAMNCSHKIDETKTSGLFDKETRLDQSYSALLKDKPCFENDSTSSNSDKGSSISSQAYNNSCDSESLSCDREESPEYCISNFKSDYPMCKECKKRNSKYAYYQSIKCPSDTKVVDSCLNLASTKGTTCHSNNIRDIKSKLCLDCAQSIEFGPPGKQSASRSQCHKSDFSLSNSSNLRSAVPNSREVSQFPIHEENSSKRCTMLTAREMSELIHGDKKGKSNDSKVSHVGVTSKVTSWIQKQKDKRKPVFFIGDAPFFSSSNYKEGDMPERSTSRRSKRSLSLSSVREDEISTNSNGIRDSSLNLCSVRLNPSSDDIDQDHKHLYIKRASSSCSNRGSARRKIRQGSPVSEEKEPVAKNFRDHRNQVDGCIASWSKRQNNNIEHIHSLNHLTSNDQSDNPQKDLTPKNAMHSLDEHEPPESPHLHYDKIQNKDTYISTVNIRADCNEENDEGVINVVPSKFSSLDESSLNLSSLIENKGERSSFSKRLLNIKQLTRALSLHSLKKKTKESLNEQPAIKTRDSELAPSTHFSKWTRNSKRKFDNCKYGSLRKSLSYCELTVREANISGKSNSQVSSYPEIKSAAKSSAGASVPLTNSICYCSATLRRSVSLFWKFPLSRCLEYSVHEPKSEFLARLCVSRLCRRNGILPFVRQLRNKKILDKMKDSETSGTVFEKHLHPLDTPKHQFQVPVIVLKPETLSKSNDSFCQKKNLNSNEEKSSKPDVIMGLGNNHALNETSNCSSLKMVEEYVPFENSTKMTENHLSLSGNKNKVPGGLRLRTKATSRSERHAKGKSTSELCGRTIRKTVSDALDPKRRPTSQFYDLDELECKSDSSNGPNLKLSSAASGSQPILSVPEQISDIPKGSSNLISRHLSLHTSTPQLSPADSLLQRFRKSFAQRFQKKKPDPILSAPNMELLSTTIEAPEFSVSKASVNVSNRDSENHEQINSLTKSSNTSHSKSSLKSNENKASPRSNSKQIQSCLSDGRKKNRRKADWRLSLIYDSVDSIFDSTTKSSLTKCHGTVSCYPKDEGSPNFTGSDANILRKRAASTSDYSPKSKAIQRPVSVADYLTLENSPCTKVPDGQNDLTRTASDTTSSEEQQKNLTSLDQIWRANPVKLCRVHSRLLMCRHKGRYRLRRSISQPVELEMTGSVHNLRDSTHGSADHENFQKGSLSSDDEASSESDIYHSYCCSPTRRSNTCWELSGDGTMYAEALWDHETIDPEELPFQAGDIIEVTDTSDQDWWWGTKDGHGGWFPSAFVRLYVSHRTPSLHFNGQPADGIQIPYSPCKVSMNNLSCEQVRANIVQEIVATERDYVKHLKDVVEGYLKQVHRRPDMFSKERIETVFGNIKEIYTFQSQFLKQLEECLEKDNPHLSEIGNCFLNHKEEFKMYSQYCNNHPLAVSELQELYCDSQYIHFFEACRLLQEMIDISLDGFLLTPIQRICKYPLQLAELLKFTDANHPDHVPVTNALAAMKEVAELVNERKRRMECLERIAEWQNTIEGWEGPDVLDTSSILIHCGEVTRVSSSWSRDIYLFIFDHLLIYCKKDLLKRHTYAYKGRLNLDNCDIVDVEDGKDSQFAVNVKNAWKIYCKDKEKWYLFYAKTSPEKDQWLRAFKAERQRVLDDEKQAFVVTEEAKKSARLAVHNKQKPKRPRAKFTKGRRCHPDVAVTELLLDLPSAKARSGSLPSNIHPELAIMAGAKLGPTRKKGSGWFHFGSGKKPKS